MMNFEFIYKTPEGEELSCYAKNVSRFEYEVYVIEKGIVLKCNVEQDGAASCNFQTKRNIKWIDDIVSEVEKHVSRAMVSYRSEK